MQEKTHSAEKRLTPNPLDTVSGAGLRACGIISLLKSMTSKCLKTHEHPPETAF